MDCVLKALAQEVSIVLVTLTHTDGSTPRKAGAKMIVYPDASIIGTIGGGAFEFQAIKKALEVYNTKQSIHWQCDLEDLGMACGGQGSVLIEYI
jgi:xanthine/CO dehydrogenase XdhC/CoxF family maturation factor